MANTMSIRRFILGLLARQSMSGYDIKRFLKSLSWLIDSPSFGSLYPALHALLQDGLVTVEVVPRQDKPPRKIYSVTDAGRQVLRRWMDQPVPSDASLKAFVMHLILASNLSPASLIARLQQRRAQVAAHHLALEQTAQTTDEGIDLGERLALDYGLALATAELAWLDRTLARLPQPSPSVEVETVQSGSATLMV
jgi:PadR family transcriptional regulator AphA